MPKRLSGVFQLWMAITWQRTESGERALANLGQMGDALITTTDELCATLSS